GCVVIDELLNFSRFWSVLRQDRAEGLISPLDSGFGEVLSVEQKHFVVIEFELHSRARIARQLPGSPLTGKVVASTANGAGCPGSLSNLGLSFSGAWCALSLQGPVCLPLAPFPIREFPPPVQPLSPQPLPWVAYPLQWGLGRVARSRRCLQLTGNLFG